MLAEVRRRRSNGRNETPAPEAKHALDYLRGLSRISDYLGSWEVPCLIIIGEGDVDFPSKAQRAAEEILTAECISIMEIDHYAADTEQPDDVVKEALRTLHTNS